MTTTTMTPTQFYELRSDGKMVFRVDNQRLSTNGTCGQLFEYVHMKNYRGKHRAPALNIGGWWARTMELFYHEMSFGTLPSFELTQKFAADAWNEYKMDGLTEKFTSNHATVMVADYWYKFAEQDFKNWKIIGTEVGFGMDNEVLVGEDDEVVVYYVGKPDLVIYEYASDKVIVCDHKTTAYIKSNTLISYKPHPQTAGYVLVAQYLAQHAGFPKAALTDRCIINIAGKNPPAEKPRDGGPPKPRFIRVTPNYSQAELEEWRRQILWKCHELKHSIITGEWVRREGSCHIYGGCSFRGVCAVPPASRDIVLKADFVQVEPWTPYTTEDED